MKHPKTTNFIALDSAELQNTFGGKTEKIYYVENGVLKWKEIKVN